MVEYIAATSAVCQVVWLRRLLSDFNQKQVGATEILYDYRSTIAITKNLAFHSRTKHIDICYHFIRSLVFVGKICLKACDTTEQAADIFLNSLPQAKHGFFKTQLRACDFE